MLRPPKSAGILAVTNPGSVWLGPFGSSPLNWWQYPRHRARYGRRAAGSVLRRAGKTPHSGRSRTMSPEPPRFALLREGASASQSLDERVRAVAEAAGDLPAITVFDVPTGASSTLTWRQ